MRTKHAKSAISVETVIKLTFFPVMFIWLEVLLHLYMKHDFRFWPIYVFFGASIGFIYSAVVCLLSGRASAIVANLLNLITAVIYMAELIARLILQTFYPASSLGVAAENHLSDYSEVIISNIRENIPILLAFLLPFLAYLIWTFMADQERQPYGATLAIMAAAICHLSGLCAVSLPEWNLDLDPKYLYSVDTNIDDQVEQLGLSTMIRLDLKHMIVPAESAGGEEFEPVGPIGPVNPLPGTDPNPSVNPDPNPNSGNLNPNPVPGDDPIVVTPDPPQDPTPTEKPLIDPTKPVDTSPNVMNIDLASLASATKDKDVKWLANYFQSVQPTSKNAYTGVFEGFNVIFISAEGLSGYGIDKDLTPTLYKMQHEGFYLPNYYTALHFTSTSNGECQHLLGLYPRNGQPITMKRTGELGTNCYFSLAQQLGREGYVNYAFHNNQNDLYGRYASHTNLGYDYRYCDHGMPCEYKADGKTQQWPQRDSYMADVTTDVYMNSKKPFNVYYMTISGHTSYSMTNWVGVKYKNDPRLEGHGWSDSAKAYMATCIELDEFMSILLKRLEAAGKLDNTLIVLSPDHVPYSDIEILEELTGQTFASSEDMKNINEKSINFEVYHSAAIIWSNVIKTPITVNKVCCQVDLLPTVSNLLGLTYDSRMLDGTDLMSESEGLVVFSSRSWKSDRGFYNRFTQTFTPAPGVTMTKSEQDAYVAAMKTLVGYKLDSTHRLIETDFYDVMQPYIKKN